VEKGAECGPELGGELAAAVRGDDHWLPNLATHTWNRATAQSDVVVEARGIASNQ